MHVSRWDLTARIRGASVIERLRIDLAANELSRHLDSGIQLAFRAFELGAGSGEGWSGQGGRP